MSSEKSSIRRTSALLSEMESELSKLRSARSLIDETRRQNDTVIENITGYYSELKSISETYEKLLNDYQIARDKCIALAKTEAEGYLLDLDNLKKLSRESVREASQNTRDVSEKMQKVIEEASSKINSAASQVEDIQNRIRTEINVAQNHFSAAIDQAVSGLGADAIEALRITVTELTNRVDPAAGSEARALLNNLIEHFEKINTEIHNASTAADDGFRNASQKFLGAVDEVNCFIERSFSEQRSQAEELYNDIDKRLSVLESKIDQIQASISDLSKQTNEDMNASALRSEEILKMVKSTTEYAVAASKHDEFILVELKRLSELVDERIPKKKKFLGLF